MINNKFKIMFVDPRYHTNQINIVETLIKQDNKVKYFVVKNVLGEDYDI